MSRTCMNLDADWRFHLGDIAVPPKRTHGEFYSYEGAKTGGWQRGPAGASFDDSSWRQLSVPHDFCVEGPFTPDSDVVRGYRPAGKAWYRKTFEIPAEAATGCRLLLVFDGMARDSKVFLNSHYLGGEESGFIPVVFDITDQARYGAVNCLAVHLDVTQTEGWWFEGGGINRHVKLFLLPETHFVPDGAFLCSDVGTADGKPLNDAQVHASYELVNDCETVFTGSVVVRLLTGDGRCVSQTQQAVSLEPWTKAVVQMPLMTVASPALWSPDTPNMYSAVAELHSLDGNEIDTQETPFGIRQLEFTTDGFRINGVLTKIKGTCNHVDHPGVGTAIPEGLHAYRILRMKEAGSNAWRCAHNPPASEFLDACDRLGMLVMDETRCMNSTPSGLHQLESMLRRDRNHPSVFIWSIGNEEIHCQGNDTGKRICTTLKRIVRQWDTTRPVCLAMNGSVGKGASAVLDVQGINYFPENYDTFHKNFPNTTIIATESSPAFCTRGVYDANPPYGYFNSYDVRKVKAAHVLTAEIAWNEVDSRPWVLGEFTWPGLDYHGEPEPYSWPCVGTNMGITDNCGFPKDHFYYYQAWWTDKPVLHIFPHWNWQGHEGETVSVWCYANCSEVELLLNGTSLGRQCMPHNGHLEWKVRYEKGTLEARGWKKQGQDGKPDCICVRQTTGAPVRLKLIDETPDGVRDVSVLAVTAVDASGAVVPTANALVRFAITGNGVLVGTGNGDPLSHESEQGETRHLFNGWCQLIVRHDVAKSGDICQVVASSEPLVSALLTLGNH